jgi:hypothetical protein
MSVQWTRQEDGNFTGIDEHGNRFSNREGQEIMTVELPDGRTGKGWSPDHAIAVAMGNAISISTPEQGALKELLNGTKLTGSPHPSTIQSFPLNSYNKLKLLDIAAQAAPCGSTPETVIEYYRAFLAELSTANSGSGSL